jgi:hypothetical protein
MISIDLKRPPHGEVPAEVVITVDRAGLEALLAQLSFLANGRTDHLDLMSPAWGGDHLSGVPQAPSQEPIHYAKVMLTSPATA